MFFFSFFLVLSSVFGTVLVLVLVLGILELITGIRKKSTLGKRINIEYEYRFAEYEYEGEMIK